MSSTDRQTNGVQVSSIRALDSRALDLGEERTPLVGVILSSLSDSFFADVVHGIADGATKAGFGVLLGVTHGHVEQEERCIELMLGHDLQGLLYVPGKCHGRINQLHADGMPVVQLCNSLSSLTVPYVDVDHERGAYLATRHLLEAGHRRVAHLSADYPGDEQGARRLRGYRTALQEVGIDPDPSHVVASGYSYAGGREAMRGLLGMKAHPTAVFAACDSAAWGAMDEITEAGLSTPDDIALVGFDDMPWAAHLPVPLSTVAQPKRELGEVAFQLLHRQILGEVVTSVVVQAQLIPRRSSGVTSRVTGTGSEQHVS